MKNSFRNLETTTDGCTVEVLYQRLGGKWYCFVEKNGEIYSSQLNEDQYNFELIDVPGVGVVKQSADSLAKLWSEKSK